VPSPYDRGANRAGPFPDRVISGCAGPPAARQVNLNKRTPPREPEQLPGDPWRTGRTTTVRLAQWRFQTARRTTYRRSCGLGRV